MPCVEVTTIVNGKPIEIYPILRDMEKYPEFMKDLISVQVVERMDNSTVSKWVSNVDGRIIKWTERDTFDDENMSISYCQIEGDLKKFQGEWLLTADEEGTEIKLTADFEFGIPMISGLLNPILKRKLRENAENMLESIKRRVERSCNLSNNII